jgi:DNA-binding CsgD family transcriptional regulator
VARHLSTAEFEVLSHFVEGLTYEQIARERGRSSRTIANQISAVFRKLRVSGRRELLALLAAREHELLGGAPQDCPSRER